MKFLCVACDEPMKLSRTGAPEDGSMSVVFTCPRCGNETAMLTNSAETQMVRSLGVRIGGGPSAPEPMRLVRSALAGTAEPAPGDAEGDAAGGSKCPFSGMVEEAMARAEGAPDIVWTREAEARIERVPSFVRSMVRKGVEMHARENGRTEIDEAMIDEVKERFGM